MKNAAKKIVLSLLAATLLLGNTACSSGAKKSDAIDVGIVQMADNGAFTDMREGFIARMRELGYTEEKMTFDYKIGRAHV